VLLAEIVKVSCVVVTEVMASDVPLTALLIFFVLSELPVIFYGRRGATGIKYKSRGALRMIVPRPAFPLDNSVYIGAVRLV